MLALAQSRTDADPATLRSPATDTVMRGNILSPKSSPDLLFLPAVLVPFSFGACGQNYGVNPVHLVSTC